MATIKTSIVKVLNEKVSTEVINYTLGYMNCSSVEELAEAMSKTYGKAAINSIPETLNFIYNRKHSK